MVDKIGIIDYTYKDVQCTFLNSFHVSDAIMVKVHWSNRNIPPGTDRSNKEDEHEGYGI